MVKSKLLDQLQDAIKKYKGRRDVTFDSVRGFTNPISSVSVEHKGGRIGRSCSIELQLSPGLPQKG
jgi:hypothetical protein